MPCPHPPTTPEQVGATTREGARAMYLASPHLIPCPHTDPAYQWIPKTWCEKRCKHGKWQKKSPRLEPGASSHNLMTDEVPNE